MDTATIAQTLIGTLLNPLILASAVLVSLVLLTGSAARVLEHFQRS